jgi:PAS domain S-box-containing protein
MKTASPDGDQILGSRQNSTFDSILSQNDELFRLIADTAPVMIWVSGTDKLCTYFNKRWLDFTGRPLQSELGNGWAEGVHPDDLSACLAIYTDKFERREEFQMEYRLRRHDGEYRWIFDTGSPRFNSDQSFAGYIGSCIDVSERKRTEEALRESEERFRIATRAGKMFAYEWDAATDVITRSGDCAHILGLDEQTPFTGQKALNKVHPEDLIKLKAAIAELSPQTPDLQVCYRMLRPHGDVIWIERKSTAHFNEQGKLVRVTGMMADITERKLAEESQSLLRKLLDGSNDAFEVIDPQTMRFLDVNEKACQELGYSREELLSLTVQDIDPHAGDSCRTRVFGEIERAGFLILDSIHRRKDGSVFPVELNIKLVHLDRSYIVCVSRDISERKRAEQELDVFHNLYVEASLGIAVEDLDGKILLANPALCSILGYTIEELLRMHCSEFADAEDSQDDWTQFKRMRAGAISRYSIEKRYRKKDGTKIWGRLNVCLLHRASETAPLALALVEDITVRKLAEEALRNKEAQLLQAQRIAGLGSWQWDPVADVVVWSEELYRIAGRDPNLPAPNYQRELWQFFTAESWARLRDVVDKALRDGTPYEIDLEMIRPDGNMRWIVGRGEAMYDSNGGLMQLRGTVQDITERKQAEAALSSLGRRLISAQETERSRIARDLHDDIGQRLALLTVTIEEMRRSAPDMPDELHSNLEDLLRQISDISSDVQAISHELHSHKLEHLGVVVAMRGFCKELSYQQKVEITFRNQDVPPHVPQEIALCLFRVLQEALHNAVKHSQVRYFEVELRGTTEAIYLTVHDGGVGFDPDTAFRGRGLGLTSMQERVKLVNGDIVITSQPKRGTTLRACVPFYAEQIAEAAG